MTDDKWRMFFIICNRVLDRGSSRADLSENWCAWTTFDSLQDSLHYWSGGLPTEDFLAEDHVRDSSPWSQPFSYRSIAHVVIPRIFYWEITTESGFKNGRKRLDLDRLSLELKGAGIEHRITDLILEIKLY